MHLRKAHSILAAVILLGGLGSWFAALQPAGARRPAGPPGSAAPEICAASLPAASGADAIDGGSSRLPVVAQERLPRAGGRPGGGSVHGRVVDRLHDPVPGASVCLHAGIGGPGPGRDCLAQAKTDASGRFVLDGVPLPLDRLGSWVIHDAHAPAWFERAFAGGHAELDVGLWVVAEGGAVAGRVVDHDGDPLPDASVRLRGARERPPAAHLDELLPAGATDARGRFELLHVPAGAWTLVATANGCQEANGPAFQVENGRRVELGDVGLVPGFRLEGLVLDSGGQPVPRAAVSLLPGRGSGFGARTDASGRFALDHLPAGPARIAVHAGGYLRFECNGLDPSSAPPWLVVTLREGLVLGGLATDAVTGRPVERFRVSALRLGGLESGDRLDGGLPLGRAAGDDLGRPAEHPGGRFALGGLEEGFYRIALQSPEHTRWYSEPIELREGAAPIVSARLERGATITGRVRTAGGGALAAARVELHAERGAAGGGPGDGAPGIPVLSARTGRAGEFALTHAPPGRYRVQASAAGYAPALGPLVELGASPHPTLELTLEPLGTLTGSIGDGCGAGTARVVALPIGRGLGMGCDHSTALRPDGSYRIDLAPGDYAVRAACDPAELWRSVSGSWRAGTLAADVTVRAGETVRFDARPMMAGEPAR